MHTVLALNKTETTMRKNIGILVTYIFIFCFYFTGNSSIDKARLSFKLINENVKNNCHSIFFSSKHLIGSSGLYGSLYLVQSTGTPIVTNHPVRKILSSCFYTFQEFLFLTLIRLTLSLRYPTVYFIPPQLLSLYPKHSFW
jgi:hypothetical protein